jgi:hypothetical protein
VHYIVRKEVENKVADMIVRGEARRRSVGGYVIVMVKEFTW